MKHAFPWWVIGVATVLSAWRYHHVDYRAHPPHIEWGPAAMATLNAAYARYDASIAPLPWPEQGFCATRWSSHRRGWNGLDVWIDRVEPAEQSATPIGVVIPCASSRTASGRGIIIHLHPPQQCVIYGAWERWSDCVPTSDTSALCRPSARDLADTATHPGFPARVLMCGRDQLVLYHATDLL